MMLFVFYFVLFFVGSFILKNVIFTSLSYFSASFLDEIALLVQHDGDAHRVVDAEALKPSLPMKQGKDTRKPSTDYIYVC